MSPATVLRSSRTGPMRPSPSPSDWRPQQGRRRFHTDFRYSDRVSKARYVWSKYEPILRGKVILDVGADECHLKNHLDDAGRYWGIGLGGRTDQEIDLESGKLPFADASFDCVLCLDVLEHLEQAHGIFDELCRVTREHVIVSLPNPWQDFWAVLRGRPYSPDQPLKFYGLPCDPPEDRHRWFFGPSEARRFVTSRAAACGMTTVQLDHEGEEHCRGWRQLLYRLKTLRWRQVDVVELRLGSLWAVLKKHHA